MEVNIFVAEYATFHQDRTFTAVRGGIDRFQGEEGDPIPVQGQLIVMMNAGAHETGEHTFKLSVIDRDGTKIAPDIDGEFSVPEGGGKIRFSVPFQFQIEDPGKYEFGFSINGETRSRWGFETDHIDPSDSQSQDDPDPFQTDDHPEFN